MGYLRYVLIRLAAIVDSRGCSVPVQFLLGAMNELNRVKEWIGTVLIILCSQRFCFCLNMKPTPCKQVVTKEDSRCGERGGREIGALGEEGRYRAIGKDFWMKRSVGIQVKTGLPLADWLSFSHSLLRLHQAARERERI